MSEMKEHLTLEELLTSIKWCRGHIGNPQDNCIGCPNAVPGTEDRDGFCECRFNRDEEMIYVLESIIGNKK